MILFFAQDKDRIWSMNYEDMLNRIINFGKKKIDRMKKTTIFLGDNKRLNETVNKIQMIVESLILSRPLKD